MTVGELLAHFKSTKQWIDITSPSGRILVTKDRLMAGYDYIDSEVSLWHIQETGILFIRIKDCAEGDLVCFS